MISSNNIPILRKAINRKLGELSAARADAVVELLAKKYGIPQERMVAAAYGEYRPVADNATAEGRARNRRIEIIMSRK